MLQKTLHSTATAVPTSMPVKQKRKKIPKPHSLKSQQTEDF